MLILMHDMQALKCVCAPVRLSTLDGNLDSRNFWGFELRLLFLDVCRCKPQNQSKVESRTFEVNLAMDGRIRKIFIQGLPKQRPARF